MQQSYLHLDVQQLNSLWFGIRTRSNSEKFVAAGLEARDLECYLPLYERQRRWSDRIVNTMEPLFRGYVFCRFATAERVSVLSTPGVVAVVGFGGQPAPIPNEEIDAVRAVLTSGLAAEPCPFLQEGQRVRITQGSLQGLEGILIRKKADCRLVVSVGLLQRSISVEIDSQSIVPSMDEGIGLQGAPALDHQLINAR